MCVSYYRNDSFPVGDLVVATCCKGRYTSYEKASTMSLFTLSRKFSLPALSKLATDLVRSGHRVEGRGRLRLRCKAACE